MSGWIGAWGTGGTATVTNLTVTGSEVISVNTSTDALRITQTGTGNALVVEDSVNPDSTPFIVDSVGKSAVTMDGGAFLKGDTLIAINQNEVKYRLDFENIKKKYADSIVVVTLLRGTDTVNVKAFINGSGQLGVFLKMPADLFTTVHKEFNFIQCLQCVFAPDVLYVQSKNLLGFSYMLPS